MGQKVDLPICTVCHALIDIPTSPCSLCGIFYHKSPYCSSIHARICRPNPKKPSADIIENPHKPVMPNSKDLFH